MIRPTLYGSKKFRNISIRKHKSMPRLKKKRKSTLLFRNATSYGVPKAVNTSNTTINVSHADMISDSGSINPNFRIAVFFPFKPEENFFALSRSGITLCTMNNNRWVQSRVVSRALQPLSRTKSVVHHNGIFMTPVNSSYNRDADFRFGLLIP